MVEVISKTIGELFTSIGGDSKYSLKYINEHPGDYPVYSAKTTGDMTKGYIDTYDYDVECLQITSNGANAGTVFYRQNQKFSVGADTRIYLLKDIYQESVSVKFLYYAIKSALVEQDFSWTNKAGKTKLLEIAVDIPAKSETEFDLKKQEEIVRQFELIENRKAELAETIEKIRTAEVDVLSGELGTSRTLKVSELFDLTVSTNSSKFTKTFVKEHSGDIPVYGASSDDVPSYGYIEDDAVIIDKETGKETPVRYFEDCLTYNIDGLAGYIFYHKERFSLSEKVRPLIIRKQYKDVVNPLYLRHVLEPLFRANVKGRKGERGRNEYTKLNHSMIKDLEIEIPVTSNGVFDIDKQNKIVANAQLIQQMKQKIEHQGHQYIQANLNFNSDGIPYIYIYITVDQLFELKRGMSKYTKKYCLDHRGSYPVYSANNISPLGYQDKYDYNGRHLTVSLNGIAGKVTILDNQFSLNADRMILLPKIKDIDIDYVAVMLEPLLREKTKGRKGEKGKNEYTKIDRTSILNTQIPVPFNTEGEIDKNLQSYVKNKYQHVKVIQKQLDEEVEKLLSVDVSFK